MASMIEAVRAAKSTPYRCGSHKAPGGTAS